MKHLVGATALLLAAMAAGSSSTSAVAQPAAILDNPQIDIAYGVPTDANHRPIYEHLRDRRVLEQLKQFLAPLRLPRDERLRVQITSCGGDTNAYFRSSERSVTICYEYVNWYRRVAPRHTTEFGLKPEDGIIGPFLEVLFHELGHAVFFLYKVPLFGREEDAADQIAGYLLSNFGKDIARRTLLGAAHFNDKVGTIPEKTHFSDTHSTDWQRFYTTLCIAYGSDRETFKDLVEKGLLPEARAKGCAREYKQIAYAFEKHILPHIDQTLLKQVQSMQWLRPEDGTCVVTRC